MICLIHKISPYKKDKILIYNHNISLFILNKALNIIGFSYFKYVYVESIKIICLHQTSGINVWIKIIEKGLLKCLQ